MKEILVSTQCLTKITIDTFDWEKVSNKLYSLYLSCSRLK